MLFKKKKEEEEVKKLNPLINLSHRWLLVCTAEFTDTAVDISGHIYAQVWLNV